jgi:hypothetical protein
LFSVSELLDLSSLIFPNEMIYFYGNAFYITAFTFLTIEIFFQINFKEFFKKYLIEIIILCLLDVFSIYLITNLSGFEPNELEFYVELLYNTSIMVLVSLALLNYISRATQKSMYLLIGSACIVFSEVLQVAYFYVSDKEMFIDIYSILLIIAFYFLFTQAGLKHKEFKFLDTANA